MKSTTLTALLTSAALLAAPAFAQTTTPPADSTTTPPAEPTPMTPLTNSPAPSTEVAPPSSTTGSQGVTTTPPAATTTTPMASPTTVSPEGYSVVPDFTALTADKLIGISVHGPDNSDIGKVTDLDLGADGKATGLIADIGGFLGMGTHTVRLGAQDFAILKNADDRLIAVSMLTEDALKALPEYKRP